MPLIDHRLCDPPHRVTHEDKLIELANEFAVNGWSRDHPVLVGYVLEGRIQLLSGSHRFAAARMNNLPVPVLVWPYEAVKDAWGTEGWAGIMDAPLLREVANA